MQENHTLLNFTICKTTKLKQGDSVKIFDGSGKIVEYGYLLNNPVKSNGIFLANIKTQRANVVLEMVLTDAIQKI
jgi:hypothetical protein